MIIKLHFEGVREGHPGANPQYHNWKKGVSETSRAAAAPEFLHDWHRTGHHWTAFLCPVIRRRRRHCGIPTEEK